MDQSSESDEERCNRIIHINKAIERHLEEALDKSSASIFAAKCDEPTTTTGSECTDDYEAGNDHDQMQMQMPMPMQMQKELDRIKESTGHQNLVHELMQNPPAKILHKKPKKTTSFSLFDMMDAAAAHGGSGSGSLLSLPANIRDVLGCQNPKEFLSKCNSSHIQDLILGFNTTQAEVHELSTMLHTHLVNECMEDDTGSISSSSSSSFLSLHKKWVDECRKDEESISFAFSLTCNIILVSSDQAITMAHRFELVRSTTNVFESLMSSWNDAPSYQKSLVEILYLWMKCSFHHGATSIDTSCTHLHIAWAYFDPKGKLFESYLACLNSTFMIRLLIEKTSIVSFIHEVLSQSSCKDDSNDQIKAFGGKDLIIDGTSISNAKGLIMCHSLSILRIIIMNSSIWTFPYPKVLGKNDGSVHGLYQNEKTLSCSQLNMNTSIPRIDTLENDLQCVQNVAKEMKLFSEKKHDLPTPQLVERFLLRPFVALLDVRTSTHPSIPPVSKHAKNSFGDKVFIHENGQASIDPFLIEACEQSVKHIFRSCARDADFLSQVIECCRGSAEKKAELRAKYAGSDQLLNKVSSE